MSNEHDVDIAIDMAIDSYEDEAMSKGKQPDEELIRRARQCKTVEEVKEVEGRMWARNQK